jgi:hypothetical protein
VGDFFKALSDGLARFVLAWIVPSTVVVGYFVFLVLRPSPPSSNALVSAAFFALAVLTSAVFLAYASLPIYRFLEGYSLPRWAAQRLRRRRMCEWQRLNRLSELGDRLPDYQLVNEQLSYYPSKRDEVLPTRLGNALRAMEGYGGDRYGLDSQTFWYELQAVAPANLRRDTEDGRAGVDFFICSLSYLVGLAVACVVVSAVRQDPIPLLSAAGAVALTPLAYNAAVRNVVEWRSSVQALVNIGRRDLALRLGLKLPGTFSEERAMWERATDFVNYGNVDDYLRFLNGYRQRG